MIDFKSMIMQHCNLAALIYPVLLICMQLYSCLVSTIYRRQAKVIVCMWIQLVLTVFFSFLLVDMVYIVVSKATRTSWPVWAEAFHHQPWIAGAAEAAVLLAAAISALISTIRYTRSHLTMDSIKQAVDLLPVGICVSETNGQPVMVNLKMNTLSRQLTGSSLTDASAFWQKVSPDPEAERSLVEGPGDERILLGRYTLTLEEKNYIQLEAADVTALYHVMESLQEKNTKLNCRKYRKMHIRKP